MFTGMALRMVIEVGLHRERGSLDANASQVAPENKSAKVEVPSGMVSLDDHEYSSQVVLFWIVYTMDVSLCNGTGRVPGLKRHEINVRLPTDTDIAFIRAGPGGYLVRILR